MGMFRRGRREGERSADAALPILTVDQAARLRALVRTWFADRGLEAAIHPDYVELDDGNQYGLGNLAIACLGEQDGERGWPQAVDRHYRSLLEGQQTDLDAMPDEEYLAALRLRLTDESVFSTFPDLSGWEYAARWADGIRALLAVDLSDTVVIPARSDLEKHAPMATLLDNAFRNTAALIASEDLTRERIERDGRWFWVVEGESVYTSSMVIALPDLVRRFEPGADVSKGVLFAAPFRHLVGYRVVEDAESVLDALMLMPLFAVNAYGDGATPLSPQVYLWLDGQVSAVSAIDGNRIAVTPGLHLEPYLTEEGSS